jgi:RNA 2',3'-cyclic 3'-phosphodiesterase
MRIFVALDIEDPIRERIARFVEGVQGFARDVRWVRPESMHVTLKFIGEKSEQAVGEIKQALAMVKSSPVEIQFRGYGFFPTAKAPRVFWIGIEPGPQLASLASAVDERMASLGIPKEEHVFSPHLTLARGGSRSPSPRLRKEDGPNRGFQRLQEKLSALPALEFGTMTAHDFFLYQSQLSRGGSQYTKLAAFTLQ